MPAKKNSKKTAKAAQPKPANAKDPKSGQPKRSRDALEMSQEDLVFTWEGLRSTSTKEVTLYIYNT